MDHPEMHDPPFFLLLIGASLLGFALSEALARLTIWWDGRGRS